MSIVAFRTDASVRTGSGHVMRCLTLADALSAKGIDTVFICRTLPGNLFDVIEKRGHQLITLSAPASYAHWEHDLNDYAATLGVTWEEDARETIEAILVAKHQPDWLVIDHYSLDHRWESNLRSVVKNIAVIDDLTEVSHDCDLLLNENVSPDAAVGYKDLIPQDSKILIGPKYVLVRSEFKDARRNISPRDGTVKRLLIAYGGVDATNETGKALEALTDLDRSDIQVDVVIGTHNPHREQIKSIVDRSSRVTLHVQLPHLATLMSSADVALSAGGSTLWELLSLGVPSVVTTIVDNQIPAVKYLNGQSCVRWLGSAQEVAVNDIKCALQELFAQPEELYKLSLAGWEIIDGCGAERIIGALGLTAEPVIR